MLNRIEAAVDPYPKAAMFELAERGYNSPFEQLVACILSIRTYDEVSVLAAQRLFARARTPAALAALPPNEIETLIRPTTFGERKAIQIRDIARQVEAEYGGHLPCDRELLLSFAGVGPKCANLALGIACGLKFISVDVHVHRVTNRWGYVATRSPEKTMLALEEKLPEAYWIDINRLLVPFGKHICTGTLPRCSICPVLEFCQQVGVEHHR
jgi:endonuclease-3